MWIEGIGSAPDYIREGDYCEPEIGSGGGAELSSRNLEEYRFPAVKIQLKSNLLRPFPT